MVTNGWMMNGVMNGLVLSMTGLVIGPGPKMTGATGPMTGLGVLTTTGGVPSNRVLAHCQVQQALSMPAKSESSQNVAAVTVEAQDQNAPRSSRTVRSAKPGMMTNLFVGACMLIGALSAGVPPVIGRIDPETDPLSCESHMQAGLTDKSWILFDSGACANCCPEWFARAE